MTKEGYVLRITQKYVMSMEAEFWKIEKAFIALQSNPDHPKGRRLQPISGLTPCNSLIWETVVDSIEKAYEVLHFFHNDQEFTSLVAKQQHTLDDYYVEIFKLID